MKRLIITIAIIACAFAAMAQNKIFEKYAKMEDVDFVCINKAMFNLANSALSALDSELGNLVGIEKMLIINSNTAKGKSQIDKDIEVLSNDKNYEILMTARDGGESVVFISLYKPLNKMYVIEIQRTSRAYGKVEFATVILKRCPCRNTSVILRYNRCHINLHLVPTLRKRSRNRVIQVEIQGFRRCVYFVRWSKATCVCFFIIDIKIQVVVRFYLVPRQRQITVSVITKVYDDISVCVCRIHRLY